MTRLLCLVLVLFMAPLAIADKITVAAAVSLREAITAAGADYTKQTGVEIEFVFGSSGQMSQQIKSGAPIDAFVSAASAQVDDLAKANLIDSTTRRDVTSNRLVLIVPKDSRKVPDSLRSLTDSAYDRIAIGEPKTVPAGQYASEALKGAGLLETLGPRFITATNVRQVLSYVERGEVSAGFVYATDAKLAGDKVRVALTVPPELHAPIVYPGATVVGSPRTEQARKFLDYLATEPGQKRFAESGFVPVQRDTR